MLKKLRTFLIALLLVPVLAMSANAFTTETDTAVGGLAQQSSGLCWVYFVGRWWLLPC